MRWLDTWVVRGPLRGVEAPLRGLQGWILPPLLSLLLIPGHHSSLRQVIPPLYMSYILEVFAIVNFPLFDAFDLFVAKILSPPSLLAI